jgi:hypothetical protein
MGTNQKRDGVDGDADWIVHGFLGGARFIDSVSRGL